MKLLLIGLLILLTNHQQIRSEQQINDKIVNKQVDYQVVYPTYINLPKNRLITHRPIVKPIPQPQPQPEPQPILVPESQFEGKSQQQQTPVQPQEQEPQVTFNQATPNILPPPLPPAPKPTPSKQSQNNDKYIVPLKQDFYCGSQNKLPQLPPYDGSRLKPVRTLYGFNMYVDSKDTMVSSQIAASGTWEPGYIALIGHIVKPGNSVLNLGSQSGLEALVMGKIVGPKGKLFIFEPYSFSNQMVTKNVEMNGLSDITTIYKVGASNAKGTAIINVAYMNTGGSQIIPDPENKTNRPKTGQFGQYSETEEVIIDRVDALIPQDVKLDFALLDVEKMETKALLGMTKIIERSPNLIIMTEWQFARNPRANRNQTLGLLKFMQDKGYKPYSYNPSWKFCQVGTFSPFVNSQALLRVQFRDVFFFPKGMPFPK